MPDDFYHDDEKYRLKRDENPAPFTPTSIINHVLIPGFLGMVVALVIGGLIPSIVSSMMSQRTIMQTWNRALIELDKKFTHVVNMEWGQTNLWVFLLFGFIAGIVIKIMYKDEKMG